MKEELPYLIVVGLGGNVEPRLNYLRLAAEALIVLPGARARAFSPVYETSAWGKTDQADFLNGAVLLETSLEPIDLLDAILAIEQRLGRDRGSQSVQWGPRVIDLDILFIEGLALATDRLTAPHPHLLEREFALRPLLDVAPEARDPRDGRPLRPYLEAMGKGSATVFAPSLLSPESSL